MKSSASRHFRKPEAGVRFPPEALGVPSDSLGELSRSRSEKVGICPDSATTKSTPELLKKAVREALDALPPAFTLNAIKRDLLAGFTPAQVEAVRARFDAKVSPCPLTGCFHWDAATTDEGYGVFSLVPPGSKPRGSKTRRIVFAHRLAYELANGPIPPGLTLDHTCETKCVNPAHLEAVTNTENIRRRDERRRARLSKEAA